MDEKINQVVTKYVERSEIVIQGKRETGNRSVKDMRAIAIRKEDLSDIFPCDGSKMQIGIVGNIGLIIKMPGAVKGVSVD